MRRTPSDLLDHLGKRNPGERSPLEEDCHFPCSDHVYNLLGRTQTDALAPQEFNVRQGIKEIQYESSGKCRCIAQEKDVGGILRDIDSQILGI